MQQIACYLFIYLKNHTQYVSVYTIKVYVKIIIKIIKG